MCAPALGSHWSRMMVLIAAAVAAMRRTYATPEEHREVVHDLHHVVLHCLAQIVWTDDTCNNWFIYVLLHMMLAIMPHSDAKPQLPRSQKDLAGTEQLQGSETGLGQAPCHPGFNWDYARVTRHAEHF